MATAKKIWKGEATIKASDGYGGSDADIGTSGTYIYSGDIDLETNGYEASIIYLEHDSSGTTDNIILGIFPSVDGTDRADNALIEIEFDATGGADTQEPGIVIKDLQHLEVGLKTNGSADTFDYRIRWDAWRWDIS